MPTYTFEGIRRLLNLPLTMPTQNPEGALNNFELFIYVDMHDIVH